MQEISKNQKQDNNTYIGERGSSATIFSSYYVTHNKQGTQHSNHIASAMVFQPKYNILIIMLRY